MGLEADLAMPATTAGAPLCEASAVRIASASETLATLTAVARRWAFQFNIHDGMDAPISSTTSLVGLSSRQNLTSDPFSTMAV